jgi:hypothetical protein
MLVMVVMPPGMIGIAKANKTDKPSFARTVIAIGYRATSHFRGLRMHYRFTLAVRA